MIVNPFRREMNEALKDLITPVKKWMINNNPYINLPESVASSYSYKTQGMETFARLLWGGCFSNKDVLSESERIDIIDSIAIGTDPQSSLYWGDLSDYDQMAVEMVPISFFIFLNKSIFDNLAPEKKQNIGKWFYQINSIRITNNNWQCFIVLVNFFMRELGCEHSSLMLKKALRNLDDMYLGEGWYADGDTHQRDYYISFAIHYYLLIYRYFESDKDGTRKYLDRAIEFSDSFLYWFSDTGEALPFGRSLIYRFAQSAFWSALALNEVSDELLSVCKGIILRNVKWWLSQNIFDRDRLLNLGYTYQNHSILEFYNSSGSPYWGLKTFICLLIPKSSTFWTIPIGKLPALNTKRVITPADMVVCRANGAPYAFVNGQHAIDEFGSTECKYEKFVYSTLSGFCISKSYTCLELLAPDSTLAISINGREFFSRKNYYSIKTNDNYLVSEWVPSTRIKITSIIIPDAPCHIRVHLIENKDDITVVDGGFSIENKHDSTVSTKYGCAEVTGFEFSSISRSLLGAGEPIVINAATNSNILFPDCLIPAIKYTLKPGSYKIVDGFYLGKNEDKSSESILEELSISESSIIYKGDCIDLSYLKKGVVYVAPNILLDRIKAVRNKVKSMFRSI